MLKRFANLLQDKQLSLFEAGPATPPPLQLPPPAPEADALANPRAQRRMRLGEQHVAYELKRARRRSIGFVVSAEGLSVSAPRWVGVGEVEQALLSKAGWILRKLHEQRERAERMQSQRVQWRDGTGLPFLGETVIIVLD
ncbi:MAG: YgjP-like metallopeptidase domain-containing protein, partial [Burkholderiaceae bacterium]